MIHRCCVVAAIIAACGGPSRAADPPRIAKEGVRVFHDRAVAFVDAQLQVLRESGKWQGKDIGIAFLGINNRWDRAWGLTQKNFESGEYVVVVPTYNLPWEKMDLPGAALDHLRTAFPRTPITTRKIGVPELLQHLDRQGVRVVGIGFSSGANFVLQENVSLLVRYAQQQAQAGEHFPATIAVNSGGISEPAHARRLREAGFDVKQTGERALVTAVEQRFADFDPTGLRIPAFGMLGYLANVISKSDEPFGSEGKHGYAAFRQEVNRALVETASYITLVKGLTGSKSPLDDALAEIQRGLDRQVALDRSIQRALMVSKTLDRIEVRRQSTIDRQNNIVKTPDEVEHNGIQQDRSEIIRETLDRIEAERRRRATPENERTRIALRLHRGTILMALEAKEEDLRVVGETDNVVRRQVGLTRWSVVEWKDSDEAFLMYDATGENKEDAARTVNAMIDKLGESGVILVGNPDSVEYAQLKHAFESAGVEIKGEVNTRGKSGKRILHETAELQARVGGIAVEVRDTEFQEYETGLPDGFNQDPPEVDVEIEEIDGLRKITIKINGIPVWEIVIDEDGNIVCQGPPGTCSGGQPPPSGGASLVPVPIGDFRTLDKPYNADPILAWASGTSTGDRLAALQLSLADDFSFPPLCSPPISATDSRHCRVGRPLGEAARRSAGRGSGFSRPTLAVGSLLWRGSALMDYGLTFGLAGARPCRICLTGMLVADAGIQAGDRVVAVTDVPLMDGVIKRGIVKGGTVLSARETRGKWVAVSVEQSGRWMRGWIEAKHIAVVSREKASELANRGAAWLEEGEYDKTIADCNRAIELDPKCASAFVFRGAAWRLKGQYDKTITDCTTAIELDPGNAYALGNRGAAWLEKGECDKAIADCSKAVALDVVYAFGHAVRAEAYRQKGELDKAIADATRATDLDPDFEYAYATRGEAYRQKRELRKAIENLSKAVELMPQYVWACECLAWALVDKGERDRAIAVCDELIRMLPNSAEPRGVRAHKWLLLREYGKSIADCAKAIELDAKYVHGFVIRGQALRLAIRFDESIADFNNAIELEPKNAWAFVGRASTWNSMGESDKAIADCNRAIELAPKDAGAFAGRGRAWTTKGEYDKAVADCTRAIELAPDQDVGFYERGVVWLVKGDYDSAIDDFAKAIDLNPTWACTYQQIADAWLEKGDYDEAIAVTEKLLAVVPDGLQSYLVRGYVLHRIGSGDEAIAAFDKALQLDSNSVHALTGRARVWTEKGELDKAIRDSNRAVDLRPRYHLPYANRAAAWNAKGQYGKAIADCNFALQLNPNSASAYNNRGNAWAKVGRMKQALADYNQAIRLAPGLVAAYANRGHVKFAMEDYEDAMANYEQVLAWPAWPNVVDALVGCGAVHLVRDEWDEAIADYELVLERDRSHVAALLGRGAARRAKGDFDGALADFGEVVRVAPRTGAGHYACADVLILMERRNDAVAVCEEAMRMGLAWSGSR